MKNNQLNEMGDLINASHTSLRDDFEVSSDALNAVVQIAQETDDCLGARMMGAGFGGCALALVRGECVQRFIENVKNNCCSQASIQPNIYEVNASSGVRIVKIN
jgi:galactokinase